VSPMARRYPVSALIRARELREADWSYRKIAELIHRETGHKPAATTVALWCYPEGKRHSRREAQNHKNAVTRSANRTPRQQFSPEWKRARMIELRDRGLSFEAIGQVAGVWWGEPLSEAQVAKRLGGNAGKRKYERRKAAA
jgi:hypothetical protein